MGLSLIIQAEATPSKEVRNWFFSFFFFGFFCYFFLFLFHGNPVKQKTVNRNRCFHEENSLCKLTRNYLERIRKVEKKARQGRNMTARPFCTGWEYILCDRRPFPWTISFIYINYSVRPFACFLCTYMSVLFVFIKDKNKNKNRKKQSDFSAL